MTTRHASCSCGQLKVTTRGEPIRISVCHCLACQQRTGSAFGAQARFARENVTIEGRSVVYIRTADSGNKLRFNFCPDCGATVHYHIEHIPDVIAVPLGAFADPQFPAPKFSVYESRQHAWVCIAGDVERTSEPSAPMT
jgi:hypothetical protein